MNIARKKYDFLSTLNLDADVVTRLSHNLYDIEKGNDNVLLTPIGKDNEPQSILEQWTKVYTSNLSEINNNLQLLEANNKDKFGPRSISKPWLERKDSVEEYFKAFTNIKSPLSYPLNDKGRLRPITLEKAASKLKNSTNSGLPFYTKKSLVKDKVVQRFNEYLDLKMPCILFTRTQEQNKTRTVWGFPIADTLNESMFYFPLLDYQKNKSYRCALLGPESTDIQLTRLINIASSNSNYTLISLDFASFDTTVTGIQKYCFDYIKHLFQNNNHDDIDYISERFRTIGLVTPDGIWYGNHGVPSGSTFTNEVDSLVQYLIFINFGLNESQFVIQGDDSVVLIDNKYKDKLLKYFKSFGLIVNESKTYSGNYSVYLQNLYDSDYSKDGLVSGIYPTYRALSRLVYQERWAKFEESDLLGKDYYAIRAISILENCKHHPLFEDLVIFIYNLDKYSLSYSKNGLKKYVDYISKTEGLTGILRNQYGDDITGINSFETVKLIRKLSI